MDPAARSREGPRLTCEKDPAVRSGPRLAYEKNPAAHLGPRSLRRRTPRLARARDRVVHRRGGPGDLAATAGSAGPGRGPAVTACAPRPAMAPPSERTKSATRR